MKKSNLLRAWRVMSWALIFFITVPVQIFAVDISPAQATVEPKVEICHATSAEGNPYGPNKILVDQSSIIGGHDSHGGHDGGVYPEENWGDIIPPYTYIEYGEELGEGCTEVIDEPEIAAIGPILYTVDKDDGDFENANIKIEYKSSNKKIKITTKNGYYLSSVLLDLTPDGLSGYVDKTAEFSSSGALTIQMGMLLLSQLK